jgi:tetratricopeptide (TPR) repeat protein
MINSKTKLLYRSLFLFFFYSISFKVLGKSELKIEELKKENKVSLEDAQKASHREMISENPLEKNLIESIGEGLKRLTKLASGLPKDSPARSKILNKLVEMALEEASYITTRELKNFNEAWDKWYKNSQKGPEPILNEAIQKEYYEEVIKRADDYLLDFPNSEERVLIFFQKAVAFQYLNDNDRAIRVFQKIIDENPTHPLASEAFFEVGSYYLDQDSFHLAKINLQAVLNFKDASRVDWTYYKLGWIEFNQGYFKECLDLWKKAVHLSREKEKESGKKNLVKEQVLKDMVFVFTELGQVEEALAYYKEFGSEENISKFLFYLAQTYFEQGKTSKAEDIYQKILDLFPKQEEAVKAMSELCSIFYEAKDYKKLWLYLDFWSNNYRKDSPWGLKNPAAVEDNIEKTRDAILYYAQKMQEEAQSESVKADKIIHSRSFLLKKAQYGYELYLELYPDSERLAEVLEYLADINYALMNYKDSAKVYEKIVRLPKEKAVISDTEGRVLKNIHKRAALNMLDVVGLYFQPYYEDLLKEIPDFSKPVKKTDEKAKDFMRSCALYIKNYPEDFDIKKKCYLFSSEIFYRTGNKVNARKYLAFISTKFRKSKEGALALGKLMTLYENNTEAQVKLAKKFLAYPEYQNSEVGNNLNQLLRTMVLKKIVQEENESKRGEMYEQYALQNPKDADVDLILFNAAIAYLATGKEEEAIRIFKALLTQYPNFSKQKEIILQLANIYEAKAQFSEALKYFLFFSEKFPEDDSTKGVLQKVCFLSFVEKDKSLIENCSTFSSKYPEEAKTLVETFLSFSLYEKNFELYTTILSELYVRFFKLSANEKFLKNYDYYRAKSIGENSETSFRDKILSLESPKNLSSQALALYMDIHSNIFEDKLYGLKFSNLNVSSVSDFQKNLQENFSFLKQAEMEASKILAFKDASSTMRAYASLAFLYKEIHISLQKNPPIKGVSNEQLDQDLKPTRELIFTQFKNYLTNAKKIAEEYQVIDKKVFEIKKEFALLDSPKPSSEEWMTPLYLITLDVDKKFSQEIPFRSE